VRAERQRAATAAETRRDSDPFWVILERRKREEKARREAIRRKAVEDFLARRAPAASVRDTVPDVSALSPLSQTLAPTVTPVTTGSPTASSALARSFSDTTLVSSTLSSSMFRRRICHPESETPNDASPQSCDIYNKRDEDHLVWQMELFATI